MKKIKIIFEFIKLIVFECLFITFVYNGNAFAQNLNSSHENVYQLRIDHKIADQEIQVNITEFPEASIDDVRKVVHDLHQARDIVVTTDNASVMESALLAGQQGLSEKKIKIVPFGSLVKVKSQFNKLIEYHSDKVKMNLKKDKIGLTIAFVSMGIDSYFWIHSGTLGIHEKSSLVAFNIMLFATFGVNPDLWPSIARPMRNNFMKVFDKFKIDNQYINAAQILTSQYLANLMISSFVQTTRVTLLSMDHMLESFQSSHFWGTAVGTAALATFSQFAWSEMSGSIDINKYPKSVIILRRLTNMRTLLINRFASISQVLQPGVYGYSPIGVMLTHAVVGVVFLLNTEKIIQFLEANKYVDRLYRKNQKIEHFLESMKFARAGSDYPMTCKALFN